MARQKGFDPVFVLAPQNRTGRVDDSFPGTAGCVVEQAVLKLQKSIEPLRREPPFLLRLPAPRARAAARRVDEDGVEHAIRRACITNLFLNDGDTGAHDAGREL